MDGEEQRMLRVAVEAARMAGEYLLENRGTVSRASAGEKRKNDLVTQVDRGSEEIIVKHLLGHFPNHTILAEEGGLRDHASAFRWIIDPLDGTTNFVRNLPVFCVSIGLMQGAEMVAGTVFAPATDECFTAVRGFGAMLNGEPISVSGTEEFGRALLATGFPHQTKLQLPPYLYSMAEIFHKAAGIRRMGAAAVDLCYTACGRFDGFWEQGLHPWDIAAGTLIIEEAGGLVTDFHGGSRFLDTGYVVAGNPGVQRHLQQILSRHFRGEHG